jgi:hypothetical protein
MDLIFMVGRVPWSGRADYPSSSTEFPTTVVYYIQSNESQAQFASQLYDDVKREFPEVKQLSFRVIQKSTNPPS